MRNLRHIIFIWRQRYLLIYIGIPLSNAEADLKKNKKNIGYKKKRVCTFLDSSEKILDTLSSEVVAWNCSIKRMVLRILQDSQ